jgi:hypothetical protein
LAAPPGWNCDCGMSTVVITLEVIRNTLIITAAVLSSRRVPRIRPSGLSSVSSGSPAICGITATPVSKPDSPNASLGNTSSAMPIIIQGLE